MAVQSQDRRLAVAVVGAGAFGRNHARVYHELQKRGDAVELVAIVDSDAARAQALARQFGVRAYRSLQELLDTVRVDAASVAVPTVQHCEVAKALLRAGADVLIEKPLASTLEEADDLIRTAHVAGRIAQVGHLERFNPAVRATVPIVTQPMFFEVHRLSPFGPRALDVDVVLDLMIHDLDIVLSFVNSPVTEVRAVGLPILSEKVDIANVRMEFESGCVANFTASRVSTERVRKLRFFQPRQYVSVDYSRQDVLVISVDPQIQEAAAVPAEGKETPAGMFNLEEIQRAIAARAKKALGIPPQFKIEKPKVAQEEPLQAELYSFLDAVRRRTPPVVSLQDGRRALKAALDILEAIRSHSQRAKLGSIS
ncbi:MAG: Gfo/Idh/MocA family oxidoreductase [Acidobacteriia bacterium]|nr:Gfo/Idh/MocA family oxidoreductase [Terriglobia bacterium]